MRSTQLPVAAVEPVLVTVHAKDTVVPDVAVVGMR